MGLHIEDVLIRKVVTIESGSSVVDAINKMSKYSTSCLIALDGNKIDGILTTRDIIYRVIADELDPRQVTVHDASSRPVIMLRPEMPLEEAVRVMLQRKIKKIPLISEDGRLMGIVSLSDIVEYHSELFSNIWERIRKNLPDSGLEGDLKITQF